MFGPCVDLDFLLRSTWQRERGGSHKRPCVHIYAFVHTRVRTHAVVLSPCPQIWGRLRLARSGRCIGRAVRTARLPTWSHAGASSAKQLPLKAFGIRTALFAVRMGSRIVFRYAHTAVALAILRSELIRECGLAPESHAITFGIRTALFALLYFSPAVRIWLPKLMFSYTKCSLPCLPCQIFLKLKIYEILNNLTRQQGSNAFRV